MGFVPTICSQSRSSKIRSKVTKTGMYENLQICFFRTPWHPGSAFLSSRPKLCLRLPHRQFNCVKNSQGYIWRTQTAKRVRYEWLKIMQTRYLWPELRGKFNRLRSVCGRIITFWALGTCQILRHILKWWTDKSGRGFPFALLKSESVIQSSEMPDPT